jgi:thiol-disulfide isomerase/thioredoxin
MGLYPDITRRAVLGGMLAALSAPARAAERDHPPPFHTVRHQFTLVRPARTLPSIRLVDLDGRATDLSALLGQVTLLNFWATWCAACRTELPILERLSVTMAGRGVRVAAIAVDQEGRNKVAPFLKSLNIRRLPVYLDPHGLVAYSDRENRRNAPFALYGMPISYIIDRAKRVVGYLPGEADWTSSEGRNLLAHYAGSSL